MTIRSDLSIFLALNDLSASLMISGSNDILALKEADAGLSQVQDEALTPAS
jgi:soluble P-type ATPase